jgi:hypothetical protein
MVIYFVSYLVSDDYDVVMILITLRRETVFLNDRIQTIMAPISLPEW